MALPRAFLSLMASRGFVLENSVLGLGVFLSPWPWPRTLGTRLHLWLEDQVLCSSDVKVVDQLLYTTVCRSNNFA